MDVAPDCAQKLRSFDTAKALMRLEADVEEIVEHGEQGNLREFGDARDEYETLKLIVGFQYGEHLAVDGCTGIYREVSAEAPPRLMSSRITGYSKVVYMGVLLFYRRGTGKVKSERDAAPTGAQTKKATDIF